jgi:hypothetical protein
MKIGDRWTFPPLPFTNDSEQISVPADKSIILTAEAGEILSNALEQLADVPQPLRGALLLTGSVGVNRIHLLRFLQCLLADPDYAFWSDLLQCLGLDEATRPKAIVQSRFVQIPEDPSLNLGAFLIGRFEPGAAPEVPAVDENTAADFAARLTRISERMAAQSLGMVVLENISERIDRLTDVRQIQLEIRLYKILAQAFSQNGILTILLGNEEHFAAPESEEQFARTYSWVESEDAIGSKAAKQLPEREEAVREQLQLQIYSWIHSIVPVWRPELSARYRRDSQALSAALPDGREASAGLVYLKSVFDPYWSDEDLAGLNASAYAWILMIVNPLDYFYEFESRLGEIAARLPRLLIWRPDVPSREEFEKLHGCLTENTAEAFGSTLPSVEIASLLEGFYITRGKLLSASRQREIHSEMGGQSLGQYLTACLGGIGTERSGFKPESQAQSACADDRDLAIEWASLIADCSSLADREPERYRIAILDWWNRSARCLAGKYGDFPEPFKTIRFRKEIRSVENPLLAMQPALEQLKSGECTFPEAMNQIGRCFGWDKERLKLWKRGLEGLAGLSEWMPEFVYALNYLNLAFPVGRDDIDGACRYLLQSIENPHHFLEDLARRDFNERFHDFKDRYMDAYILLHEDALHIASGLKKEQIKIDPVSLRNLELLSGLQYMDKSHLNRVKVLAKWVQQNQCNLPVREILRNYPRCYCNFNPGSLQQPADSAALISRTIREGIEYFRSHLRRCGHLIMVEMTAQRLDDGVLSPITALLSDGPMVPLKPQIITLLNRVISKYPNEFLSEFRRR